MHIPLQGFMSRIHVCPFKQLTIAIGLKSLNFGCKSLMYFLISLDIYCLNLENVLPTTNCGVLYIAGG